MVPLMNGFVIAEKAGVSIWDLGDGSLVTRLAEEGSYNQVAAAADGEYVAAYDFVDDVITVWRLRSLNDALVINEVEALTMELSNGSLAVGLDFNAVLSGGEFIVRRRTGEPLPPGGLLRTDRNRIEVKPGYAIVWSLSG